MALAGLDHAEMYVGDAEQAAADLCGAFGFRIGGYGGPDTGLPGQRSILLRQGGIRILVTSGLTPDHPASRYVDRHGDGVAVLGFACENAAESFRTALAGGATALAEPGVHRRGDDAAVVADVSGFGDVTHRLIERRGGAADFLPGVRAEPDAADVGGDLLKAIDHVAVCLPAGELESTVRLYERAFGLTVILHEDIIVGEQGMDSMVVQNPAGTVTLTLIEPDITRRAGQIDDFLAWHGGAGVQHVAFRTDDIIAGVRELGGRGVRFGSTPGSYYDLLRQRLGPDELDAAGLDIAGLRQSGLLVDRDGWGLMLQIFTASVHARRTLFFELIERRGARTFGSANIKALFEAKERELSGLRETNQADR
jgi:4-hydroxymandelate synthase